MYKNNDLVSIALVPMQPNGWILNGWLSSIVNIDKANDVLNNTNIKLFIKKNLDTLKKTLPLYNVKDLCISRYNLSQFFYFRILKKSYKVKNISFIYPLDSRIDITTKDGIGKKQSRWQPYILDKGDISIKDNLFVGKKTLQFNGILTLSGYPKQNKIEFEFAEKVINKKDIRFQVYVGQYDPLHASATNRKWVDIKDFRIEKNKLTINLSYDLFNNTIGYPTNFMKKFSNGRRNTYHDIHIKWLIYLGKKYKYESFIQMSNKWLQCKTKWKSIDVYKNMFNKNNILLDNNFLNFLDKYYK